MANPEVELMNHALELDLDAEKLSNMKEVVAKLLKPHKGPIEKLHLFIDHLETTKNLYEKEEQLTSIRKQKYGPHTNQQETVDTCSV